MCRCRSFGNVTAVIRAFPYILYYFYYCTCIVCIPAAIRPWSDTPRVHPDTYLHIMYWATFNPCAPVRGWQAECFFFHVSLECCGGGEGWSREKETGISGRRYNEIHTCSNNNNNNSSLVFLSDVLYIIYLYPLYFKKYYN